MLTKTLRVVAIASATLALLVATCVQPAAAGPSAPTVSFQVASTSDLSATLRHTVNREPRQIASVSCSRTDPAGTTVAVTCGSRSSSDKQTTYEVTFSNLDAGSYRFSVTFTMTDRKQASGSTTFVVLPAHATCSVTPYHLTYDGDPHAATGSCTGVGGAALPTPTLDLSSTVHTNAGTYPDTWSFSDPMGNYANESGTVTNVIDQHTQTITFSAGSVELLVGGGYVPAATATSRLPVTFAVDDASALVCSFDDGTVSFDAAGVCTIEAQQAGNTNWAPAPAAQQGFTVAQRPQTVTFGSGPVDPTVGGSYTPSATATSGLPVIFSVAAGSALICSLADGVVSFDVAGACTVQGHQPGDTTWAAAPLVQQTFTIAAATKPAPMPIPIVWVNKDDDPQSPPLPPDPAANYCPPPDLTGGGCFINALDGSFDNFFDASLSVPADLDPSRVSWHWEIFKPPTLGSLAYSSAGITGYHTPVLRVRLNSLPTLTNTALDVFWRVRLTIVVDGRADRTTRSYFQFDYQQSTLTLQMSTDCQRIGHIDGTLCTSDAANGLPATELA